VGPAKCVVSSLELAFFFIALAELHDELLSVARKLQNMRWRKPVVHQTCRGSRRRCLCSWAGHTSWSICGMGPTPAPKQATALYFDRVCRRRAHSREWGPMPTRGCPRYRIHDRRSREATFAEALEAVPITQIDRQTGTLKHPDVVLRIDGHAPIPPVIQLFRERLRPRSAGHTRRWGFRIRSPSSDSPLHRHLSSARHRLSRSARSQRTETSVRKRVLVFIDCLSLYSGAQVVHSVLSRSIGRTSTLPARDFR